MNTRDIGFAASLAVAQTPDQPTICEWLPPVVTFLASLREKTGSKFWLKIALGLVIGLIQTYQHEVCGT